MKTKRVKLDGEDILTDGLSLNIAMTTKTSHTPTSQEQLQELETEYGAAFIVTACNQYDGLKKTIADEIIFLRNRPNESLIEARIKELQAVAKAEGK